MIAAPKFLVTLLATGWLATTLAATNGDIDRGVLAYKNGDYDEAAEHYEAAEQTLGERPELHYNRGLVLLAQEDREAARKAFEHGTESDEAQVRASAEYEIGNLDFDAEAWDGAIQHYIACLKEDPEHHNAKWNLELALERKRQQEEEQEKNKDEQDQENQDQENQDQEDKDQENKDQENKDQENKDEQDQEKQDQEKQDQEKQDPPQQQPPPPQPVDKADMSKALEQLDEEDNFTLGRPAGVMRRPVAKDW